MYGKKLFSDEVWNYLHRASESAVSSEQYEVAFVAFLNMGQMYFLDRQNEQMKEAISLLRRPDVPADMPLAAYCDRYSRGLEAYMSGNYNQALAMFNSMKPLIPQGDLLAPKYELIILSAIADTCKELGDYAAAIETASLLLDLSSNLTAPESKRIADSVLQIMDNTEIITDPGFPLAVLAEHIGRSAKVVSQVVNETLGKNFKTLIGEYRIREACVRLLDTDTYGQYTIEHIAESVGFNSRSNFSVTFKKITGLTPAQFQKSSISDSGD